MQWVDRAAVLGSGSEALPEPSLVVGEDVSVFFINCHPRQVLGLEDAEVTVCLASCLRGECVARDWHIAEAFVAQQGDIDVSEAAFCIESLRGTRLEEVR